MSKWKAGQIVTVNGKVCRVTRTQSAGVCGFCAFVKNEWNEFPCVGHVDRVPELIPANCYLKEIKPKS